MLFNNNPYQHHVYMTSANSATAAVYNASNQVYSYFNLRSINEDLNQRNANLEGELISLRQQLTDLRDQMQGDSLKVWNDTARQYEFIVARVISNSIAKPYNYITLNKGSRDGIKEEMGVIDQNGVVGIVNVVGEHSSRVISLLNTNLRLSCKMKGSQTPGSLVWDGINPGIMLLEELPRHTVYQPGDTVVTSGFSGVFPEGIPVGTVLSDDDAQNENFFTLKVQLFTDFPTLSVVQVISNNMKDEQEELEKKDHN